ncbi:MAG: AbrB/MazE/SpoVT family DNA-binding domain-containing protein [Methylacidiphilales bacterium]|nr:AbrB/MazE/SpoVT family DNA-binding domain-containing protein [Candidatus Methylacidiphilales bacterium]
MMTSKLTLDKAGRVVIPKPVRDELQLSSGDSLELKSRGDEIVLRPVREEPTMFKKDGLWVIKTGKPLAVGDANAAIETVREERHRQILGAWPR